MRWHLVSSYAAVGGAHQGDCNPTLEVSTSLRVRLLPLSGQATGYPFQDIHQLHPQKPVHRGDTGREVSTLLEAILQIHLILPHFRLVEALFWVLFLVCGGASVHYTHVVNNIGPLFPQASDKNVSLLIRELWRL